MSDPTDATPDGPEPTRAAACGDRSAMKRLGSPSSPRSAGPVRRRRIRPRAMPWEAQAAASRTGRPGRGGCRGPRRHRPRPIPPHRPVSFRRRRWAGSRRHPSPLATGQPGWVIAGVGARLGAWILDGIIGLFLLLLLGIRLRDRHRDRRDGSRRPLPNGRTSSPPSASISSTSSGSGRVSGKATPGMRAFKLQVANAADGKRLDDRPAPSSRWLALGYAIALVGIIPVLAGLSSVATFVWEVVLLITTSQDTMHQGLHDRWAKSRRRPARGGRRGRWRGVRVPDRRARGGAARACVVRGADPPG